MALNELTPEEQQLLPSAGDIQHYEEHGWWISPPCLDEAALDELRFGIERYYKGERDWQLPVVSAADWDAADGDVIRQNDFVSLQIEELRNFLRRPLIPAMAARLARSRSIRLFHDQIIYKPPGRSLLDTGVGWHTDRAYWKTCASLRMLTAWIPLTDVDEQSGSMIVIDKSHRWQEGENLRYFHERDLDVVRQKFAAPGPWVESPYQLRAGQVAFHHCLTIHGSRENLLTTPRIAWTVHFQDEENCWQLALNADGTSTPHMNDLLCRKNSDGVPDYRDPEVCPELWREAP